MKKIGLFSLGVFVLLMVLFFGTSALVENGVIPEVEFSQPVQGVLAFVFFLPLFSALFFTGQHFKTKAGYYQTLYKTLTFVSVGLLAFGFIQALLSVIGVYQ